LTTYIDRCALNIHLKTFGVIIKSEHIIIENKTKIRAVMNSEFTKNSISSDSTEGDSVIRNLFILLATFFTAAVIIEFLLVNRSKKQRDHEGFTDEDRFLQENMWNKYHSHKLYAQLTNMPKLDDQTSLFFEAIGKEYTEEFPSSTSSQVIQFGIGIGDYWGEIIKKHQLKVIGYDYSPVSIEAATAKGIQMRLVNLNATIDSNLLYLADLERDLSIPSDILFIRVLEYLKPEAVKLLIISVMTMAQPGSKFYFEIFSPDKMIGDPSGSITVSYPIKEGTVPSFFNGKNNFKVTTLSNQRNLNDKGDQPVERLVIEKISF
jgi:hypothetical protein